MMDQWVFPLLGELLSFWAIHNELVFEGFTNKKNTWDPQFIPISVGFMVDIDT